MLLSWGAGSDEEMITIPKEDGKRLINIAFPTDLYETIKFPFFNWESEKDYQGEFFVKIALDAVLNGVNIERKFFDGNFIFRNHKFYYGLGNDPPEESYPLEITRLFSSNDAGEYCSIIELGWL